MSPAVLHIIIKIVIFWVLFLILHFSYDWVKRPIVAVFSGTNESFMQHAKIAFWHIRWHLLPNTSCGAPRFPIRCHSFNPV
jgi:hypothetical protein